MEATQARRRKAYAEETLAKYEEKKEILVSFDLVRLDMVLLFPLLVTLAIHACVRIQDIVRVHEPSVSSRLSADTSGAEKHSRTVARSLGRSPFLFAFILS